MSSNSFFFSYLQKGRGRINTKTRCLKKAQGLGWGVSAGPQSQNSGDVSSRLLPQFLRKNPAGPLRPTTHTGLPPRAFWKLLLTPQKALTVTPNERDP